MKLSEYLKPAIGVVVVVAVGAVLLVGHRPRPEEKEIPANALVIVTKSTNACFSDLVRVTGFIVPRREAVVGVDQEGSKVSEVLVREGDIVTDNQELARLTPPPQQPGHAATGADRAARAGRRPRHRSQDHRRRARLAAGRPDVPDFRQQRNRTGCRSAGDPYAEAQSRRAARASAATMCPT